jgi:UDPglucose 6-dehydrogenase
MRVTVIGTGYVGTVTGACLAYCGHRVTCVDTDAHKIEKLRRGEMPIYEPCLEELLQLAAARGGIDFTTGAGGAGRGERRDFHRGGDAAAGDGRSQSLLSGSGRAQHRGGHGRFQFRVVVNKSTVPVGSGNLVETLVREGIREAHPDETKRIRFGVASNPEFLREGSAIADSLYPDRIVLGAEEEVHAAGAARVVSAAGGAELSRRRPSCRGRPVAQVPVVTTTLTSAEMIKYAANAFLAVKIGFANEWPTSASGWARRLPK